MNILSFLRKLDSKRRDRKRRPEMDAFRQAVERLTAGDIAIDCGANVGIYTTMMARSGATVHAFEPNEAAFLELRKNAADYANVHAHHAAVTSTPGPVKLYLHKWADDDPVHWSTGSSVVAGKKNIREDRSVLVEGVDLADFIRGLGSRVRLLKMDIEGAEVGVLNRLLDENLHEQIDEAYVEVHDRKVPELVEPTRRLKARLDRLGATHFRLDWR
ncbi:MAG: FkbM family methyltransferase [Acidobacteria bacterium]|nr:FkbM family methyltransferase [Acidobacteriota bacterium]